MSDYIGMGKQITTPHLKIRSDLGSCHKIPAIKIQVELPDPLKHLMTEMTEIDQLPYLNNRDQAGLTLIGQVHKKLIIMPSMRKTENLAEKAKSIAIQMTQLKPVLRATCRLNTHSLWEWYHS